MALLEELSIVFCIAFTLMIISLWLGGLFERPKDYTAIIELIAQSEKLGVPIEILSSEYTLERVVLMKHRPSGKLWDWRLFYEWDPLGNHKFSHCKAENWRNPGN